MSKLHDLGEKPDKPELRPYQIDDLAFYMNNPRCANLSDPGTGKTPSVCVYAQYLWEYKGVKTAWAMPKSLLKKNVDELLLFTDFREEHIVLVDGTPKQREKQMASPEGKVFLMGFQRWSEDWKTLKEHHPEINALFVDEIHMGYKGAKSKRTKGLFQSMRKIKYFLPMTGTLIDGRLDSAYPTIHIIEPRYYYNYGQFMAQHGRYDAWSGELLGWTNHEKLGRIFQRHCLRHSFEEVYGDSEHVFIKRPCEMHPKQRKAYDKLESQALLELEDEFIDASLPGQGAIRARQVMAHPHTFELLKEGELTGKDEQLLIELEDHKNTGKPFVIFASLIPEMERILALCEKEGFRVGLINGNVPAKKRAEIDKQFRDGELDGVVASQQTASVGYNWGHVDHLIMASLDYQDSNFKQAVQRADRGNRTTPLNITILEYRDSIDQKIFAIVDRKSKDANKVDASYKKTSLLKNEQRSEGVSKDDFGLESFG